MKKVIQFILITLILTLTACTSKDTTGAIRYDSNEYDTPSFKIDIIYEDNKITSLEIFFEYTIAYVDNVLKRKNPSEYLDTIYQYFEEESNEILEQSPLFLGILKGQKTNLIDYPSISTDQNFDEKDMFEVRYHFNLKSDDFSKDNKILKKALENLGLGILFKKNVTVEELLADKDFIYHDFFEDKNTVKRTFSKEEYEKWIQIK